ncbi:MAG TPA: condensation domain-containing protein [Candidatus Kapabacteria bacterium]|nr:condensation domain-containing protein [Candidatus Kapabacteria bacterium]
MKIHGHRIEFGEIETALRHHRFVRDCVAAAWGESTEERRIVAYVVCRQEEMGDAAKEQTADRLERMVEWQRVYDEMYRSTADAGDPLMNTIGWNSSYTGLPIPDEEMVEWVNSTVEWIAAWHPGRVLEIGCGTGMLLFRIAPDAGSYVGTDFSQPVLDLLERELGGMERPLPGVKLLHRTATDFSGIEPGSFDTVILNSVAQYLPSIDDLLRVIEGAVASLSPGGRIFIGDLRAIELFEVFHTSVQAHHAGPDLPCEQLRQRVRRQMEQEEELLVSPLFFHALKQHLPAISHVDIELKRGRARNELTLFRYNVIIHTGGDPVSAADPVRIDWEEAGLGLEGLRSMLLAASAPDLLRIDRVLNARLVTEVLNLTLLAGFEEGGTVGDLNADRSRADAGNGIEPEDVRELGRDLPYDVRLVWSASGAPDRFDILLARNDRGSRAIDWHDSSALGTDWRRYANNPLQGRFARHLLPQLRASLQEVLPEYMVPAHFMVLDALPLNRNGKVNRRALPPPELRRSGFSGEYVAPRDRKEALLAAIWSNVLRLDRVGIHDNFFELGGDSIISIQIVARANQEGMRLTPKQAFQFQTIAELAAVADVSETSGSEQGIVSGNVPLTPVQAQFFELGVEEPHHWNQSLLLEPRESVNPESLREAVSMLLEHHDALRLRFEEDDSGWRQWYDAPGGPVPAAYHNLTALDEAAGLAAMEVEADRAQRSLDLLHGPLIRFVLFDLSPPVGQRLLVIAHHLIIDGVSWRILIEDLARALDAAMRGDRITLPPKTVSFKAWSEHLAAWGTSDVIRREADYWLAQGLLHPVPLPVDYPGRETPNDVASSSIVHGVLSEEETSVLLHDLLVGYRTRIDEVLLTVLLRTFFEWTGERRLLVEFERHGRDPLADALDPSRTVGWLAVAFPRLLMLSHRNDPGIQLREVKEQLRQVPGPGAGYGVLRYLGNDPLLADSLRHSTQAEVAFNYFGQFDQSLASSSDLFRLAGEPQGAVRSPRGRRAHLLEVNGFISGGTLRIEWTYSRNRHAGSTIEALANAYMANLRALIQYCRVTPPAGFMPADFDLLRTSRNQLDAALDEVDFE